MIQDLIIEDNSMQILCTLFDSNYLSRALACYDSLINQKTDFHLYLFAFDDLALKILKELKLPHTTTISLKEFEDEKLLAVKPGRSVAEYCWTCTPSVIRYVLKKYNHDHCTYIDADTYFYRSPALITEAMRNNSVVITPHFYTPEYDQVATSGIYCVQFMTFKNNEEGLKVLEWWRDACLDWCYAKFEDGKFGDQKYLDDWPTRFSGIFVSENKGEGVAPWNIQQWLETNAESIIFFHFHALKLYKNYAYMGFYKFPCWVQKKLYSPYVNSLRKFDSQLLKFSGYSSCFNKSNFKTKFKHLFLERFKNRNNTLRY